MTRLYTLLAVCATAVVAMSSCGGGGSAVTTTGATPLPQQGAKVAPPAAASRTSYGTAQLTIIFPTTITGKNATVHARSAANNRGPEYVNPTTGNVIDIYVDGTLVPDIDGLAGPTDSIKLQGSSTGTQVVAIPLYSTKHNDIVVAEWTSGHVGELAVGETDYGTFAPGTPMNVSLTMFMNALSIGMLDVIKQADPVLLPGQGTYYYYGVNASCGAPNAGVQSELGFYEADSLGQFVAVSGVGGTTPVTVSGQPNAGTTQITQTSIAGIYSIAWDGACDGVTVTASATNPIAPLISDSRAPDAPNGTYGYRNCYDTNQCPASGGLYQGLWNMWNRISETNNPQDYFNSSTVGGAIIVTASPTPAPSPSPSASPSPSPGPS